MAELIRYISEVSYKDKQIDIYQLELYRRVYGLKTYLLLHFYGIANPDPCSRKPATILLLAVKMSATMMDFCDYFAEKLELKK